MTRNEAIRKLTQPGVCLYAEQVAAICDVIDLLNFRTEHPKETLRSDPGEEAGDMLSHLVHIAETEARKRGTLQ